MRTYHSLKLALMLSLAALLLPHVTLAHVGAPYPVLLDEPVGPYVVSVLADPDVGTGTFILQGMLTTGQPIPVDTSVTFAVWPEDGHIAEAASLAELETTRDEERFICRVPFDSEGPWNVRLVLEGEAGRGEITFPVQVTPPYPSILTTLACLVPFVILGALWLVGTMRRRSPSSSTSEGQEP